MVIKEKYDRPLFIIYDIKSDRIRNKIFTVCEDFGLVSVQFSSFFGYLRSAKIKELESRINSLMNGQVKKSNVLVCFKRDVEKFVGLDGESMGPFEKGQVANLPREIVNILDSGEKVEILDED